jgi:hypothetical protein
MEMDPMWQLMVDRLEHMQGSVRANERLRAILNLSQEVIKSAQEEVNAGHKVVRACQENMEAGQEERRLP